MIVGCSVSWLDFLVGVAQVGTTTLEYVQFPNFLKQVRIRGQSGPACEVLCTGLNEAIRFGEAEFPAFAERNPWIGLDSLQRQIWILLDPETEDSCASNV